MHAFKFESIIYFRSLNYLNAACCLCRYYHYPNLFLNDVQEDVLNEVITFKVSGIHITLN